jgi:hypothetical protein
MSIEIEREKMLQPVSARERLCIKLVLLIIGMLYPAKYDHQLDKFMSGIKEELVR